MKSLLPTLLLLGTAACSNAPAQSGETAYRKGLAALEAGQPRVARVELMNAIQAAPNSPTVRLAQARTLLLLGDGDGAAAEIGRARALGAPIGETRHLMAHALLLQGLTDRAVAEARQTPPAFAAYAMRIRALALASDGQDEAAAAAFADAVAAGPDDGRTWIELARFRRGVGDLAGAIAAADRAVALDPADADALSLRGELTRSQYGLAASMPWFDRALEVDPENVTARLERAATLLEVGRTVDMLADTRHVLGAEPDNARAWFLQALLAARAGKFDLARSLYARTQGAFDDQPAAMLLAGGIELQTGHPELAADRLGRLVERQPDNARARKLLGAALWRRGDAKGAADALRPLVVRPDADSYTLRLAAAAFAKAGDKRASAELAARAAAPERRAETALLVAPVDDGTLAVLRREAEARDDAPSQIALIRALIARGASGEAIDRARRLQARNPGAPDAHILAGDALMLRADFKGAAEAYRRAANIAFTEPVALRLVEALRASGDVPAASQVLSLFLAQNPDSVPARLLAGNAFLAARQWPAAIDAFERVRTRVGDRDVTLLNNLAWAYAGTGDYEAALPLARKALALDRTSRVAADTYGWLLFKSGADRTAGLALLRAAAARGGG